MLKQRVTFSLIFKIVNSLLGLISSVFVARLMGAEAMGVLSACLAFIAIFTVFGDFGFGIAHFKRVSEGQDLGKCIGVYVRIRLVLAIVVALVALLGYHLTFYFTGKYPIDYKYYNFFLIILFSTFLTNFFSFIDMTFTARLEVIKGSTVQLTNRIFSVAFKSLTAVLGLATIYLAWSSLAGVVIGTFVAVILFRNYPIAKWDKDVFKSYLIFALPLTFVNIIETISLNIDKVFISYFVSLEDVGFYSVAQSLALLVIFPAGIITNILIPTYTNIYSKGTIAELQKFAIRIEKYLAIIIFPVVFFLFFNSRDIISLIYGNKFSPSIMIFNILVLQGLLFIMLQPYSTQLTAMERLKAIMYIGILSQGLNILLNFLLIPDKIGSVPLIGLGAVGSAVSLLASTLVATIFYRSYLLKKTGLAINYQIFIYLFIAIASTMIPAIIPWLANVILPIKLVIIFIVSAFLYLSIMWSAKLFNRDDLQFYFEFIRVSKNVEYFRSEINEKIIE
ncbi:MAG: oligosaccharide flippase family protein [Bacteroidales bacterium]